MSVDNSGESFLCREGSDALFPNDFEGGLVIVIMCCDVAGRVVERPAAEAMSDDDVDGSMLNDDVEGCYVVTIFGLKTADCSKQRARTVPSTLDSDLQVQRRLQLFICSNSANVTKTLARYTRSYYSNSSSSRNLECP